MYDTSLAERVRLAIAPLSPFSEMKMFGGIAFLVGGNMACGIVGDDLMVRVGPAAYDECLARPHARPMEFTGRPMKGMVYVGPAGISGDQLVAWIQLGLSYAGSLPPKRAPARGEGKQRPTARRTPRT
ncbi:MAG: TfoX/Sxy family protein [Chloroflexi bacterium]|nr:TfoX/Sxy family protein [Chloroflexota bacterium]